MCMALTGATIGCGDSLPFSGAGDESESSNSAAEPAGVLAHGASISPDNPLRALVRVSLSRPARVFVEYGNPLAGKFRSAISAMAAEHEISLVRLRAETVYRYAVGVDATPPDDDGDGTRGSFTTGALPTLLDHLEGRADGRSTTALLLSLIRVENANRGRQTEASFILLRDATGNIVWYYGIQRAKETEEEGYRLSDVLQLPNGNFLFIRDRRWLVEITALGEEIATIGGSAVGIPHHDYLLLNGDDRLLYLHRRQFALDGVERIFSDQLRVLHRRAGSVQTVWDAREIWSLRSSKSSYSTHLNSVEVGPHGNFVLSSRSRSQIVSLSADLRTVQWRLGGTDGDFAFENPSDRFYRQHTATELSNGNVLLFDNGYGRPQTEGGSYSRALELRLDHRGKRASKVWEHRAGPYSRVVSSAYRLSNGNTLVNYGDSMDGIVLFEVDPAGTEVFEVRHPLPHLRRYRVRPAGSSINGEVMLRAPTARRDAAGG